MQTGLLHRSHRNGSAAKLCTARKFRPNTATLCEHYYFNTMLIPFDSQTAPYDKFASYDTLQSAWTVRSSRSRLIRDILKKILNFQFQIWPPHRAFRSHVTSDGKSCTQSRRPERPHYFTPNSYMPFVSITSTLSPRSYFQFSIAHCLLENWHGWQPYVHITYGLGAPLALPDPQNHTPLVPATPPCANEPYTFRTLGDHLFEPHEIL